MSSKVNLSKPSKPKMSPEVAAALGARPDDVELSDDAAPEVPEVAPPAPAPSATEVVPAPDLTTAPVVVDAPVVPPTASTAPDLNAQLQQAQGALSFAQTELTNARRELLNAQAAAQTAQASLAAVTAERDAAMVPLRTALQAIAVPLNATITNLESLTLPQLCDQYTSLRTELVKRFPVGGKAKAVANAPVEAAATDDGSPNPMLQAALNAATITGTRKKTP